MPPGDFSVLKNLSTKTLKNHPWKLHAELAVKQLSGLHYQRNVAFKFTWTEPSGFLLLGEMLKGLLHAPSKIKDISKREEILYMTVLLGWWQEL